MKYALGRITYLVFILFAVTFLVSAMLRLMPGEPAYVIIGETATPAQIKALHEELHLDEPIISNYFRWLGDAVRGDLGTSVRNDTPVLTAIKERAPVTLELVILSQTLALLFAFPAAIYAAYRPGKWFDNATSVASFGMISIPNFVLALVLVLIFAVELKWLPVAAYTPLSEDVGENLKSMILPAVTVAAHSAGIYQRLLRSDMSATLKEDYIAMAEAKGQSPLRILVRHALRPSLFSVLTLMGLTTAQALGGSVVTEVIFGLPGLGRLVLDSIKLHDVVVVQGVVAGIAIGYVVVNGLVDLLYGVIDPRVRRGH